jgi:hypothetical protein
LRHAQDAKEKAWHGANSAWSKHGTAWRKHTPKATAGPGQAAMFPSVVETMALLVMGRANGG